MMKINVWSVSFMIPKKTGVPRLSAGDWVSWIDARRCRVR